MFNIIWQMFINFRVSSFIDIFYQIEKYFLKKKINPKYFISLNNENTNLLNNLGYSRVFISNINLLLKIENKLIIENL